MKADQTEGEMVSERNGVERLLSSDGSDIGGGGRITGLRGSPGRCKTGSETRQRRGGDDRSRVSTAVPAR